MTLETISPAADLAPLTTSDLDLASWLTSAKDAQSLAEMLVDSHFVPAAYKVQISQRSTPEEKADARAIAVANGTGAILLGRSLGVDPLTALQQIYVVHGRPGMYAKFKVALATAAGAEIWDEELTPTSVTVCGRAKGSDRVQRITITMEMAVTAGWTASNANYKKTPIDMLWARAAGRIADRVASNVLFGIVSIEDIDSTPDVSPAPKPERTTTSAIRARTAAAVAAAPPPAPAIGQGSDRPAGDVPPPPVENEQPEPTALQPRVWDAINRRFVELEVVGDGQKANRLTVISHIVGRPVSRGGELTADEGQLVLDNLAGNGGFEVVSHALGGETELETEDAEQEYDPTTEPGWGQMDGAEAAGDERG